MMRKTVCHVCQGGSLGFKKEIKGDTISTCLDCGFMFVSKKTSNSDYVESYREVPKPAKFLKRRHFDLVSFIKRNHISNVLEVGSGFGGLAFLCRLEGINYTGIEPEETRRKFMKTLSIERIMESHTEVNGRFDLILLDNVLEHVDCPKKILSDVSKHLSERGKLVIIVPNRYDFRRISKKWSSKNFWIPHDHLSYFRSRDVEALLSSSGVKLTSRLNYGNKLVKTVKTVFQKIGINPLALSLVFEKSH